MSEGMGRYLALDAELLAQLRDDVLYRTRADRSAGLPEFIPSAERRVGSGAADRVAPHLPIRGDRIRRFGVEVNRAALAALGAVDVGGAVGQIDIASPECAELGNAHACAEKEQDHPAHLQATELFLGARFVFARANESHDPF